MEGPTGKLDVAAVSAGTHHDALRAVLSSADIGWTSLLAEVVEVATTDPVELDVAPVDAQRIVLTTSGRRHVETKTRQGWRAAAYTPGSIGLSAPGVPTQLRWRNLGTGSVTETQVHLPGDVVREAADAASGTAGGLPDALCVMDPRLEAMVAALLGAVRARMPEMYAEGAALFLAAYLATARPSRPPNDDARVDTAIAYLRDNFQRQVSLAEVADEVGLSRYHFLRLFKERTGQTPFAYLTAVRVEQAQLHLRHSPWSITEIAHLCGFSSPSAFATTFRRHIGATPSAFRSDTQGR